MDETFCVLYGQDFCRAVTKKAKEEINIYLTPQIVIGDDNIVFHSEWDNLNKIKTNVTGSNVVNSAAGIMMQKYKQGATPPFRGISLTILDLMLVK